MDEFTKRFTLNATIDKLGFKILDFREGIQSIKIKTALRNPLNTSHSMGNMINAHLNASNVNLTFIDDPITIFSMRLSYSDTIFTIG